MDSFSQILGARIRSSFVPTGPDIPKISRYVDEVAKEIRSLDTEIDKLLDSIAELRKKREYLQRCHEQAEGVFAPIRRLSDDLLECIFSLFAKSKIKFYQDTYPIRTKKFTDIVYLTQVCYRWRDVIKSMPGRLWASGTWKIDLNSTSSLDYVDPLSHFILMSQSAPLDLEIVGFIPPHGLSTLHVEMLLALLQHSERWYSASLNLCQGVWEIANEELRKRPRPVRGYFPRLHKLSLCGYSSMSPTGSNDWTDLFEDAASLSSLRLEASADSFIDSFTLPYSQLESVEVEAKSLHVLPRCINVKNLVVNFRHDFDSRAFPSLPVFNILSTLDLRCDIYNLEEGRALSWALRNFTTPSLTVLRIKTGMTTNWPFEEFKAMLLRSACASNLRTLSIETLGSILMSRHQLNEIFRMMPGLVDLMISFFARPSTENLVNCATLFDLLTIRPTVQSVEEIILPCLEGFELKAYLDEEHAGKFVDMVRSRKGVLVEGVKCLRDLQFVIFAKKHYQQDMHQQDMQSYVTERIEAL